MTSPDFVLAVAAMSSLAAAGLLAWNLSLRRAIAQRSGALADSELLFRQLAENIRDVFWMTTPKMDELLYCSPAYEELWGRPLASLYADPKSMLDAIPPDQQGEVIRTMQEGKQHGYDIEYPILRPDGSQHCIRDRAFPVRNAAGEVYRTAGICQDLTAQKEAEAELREAALLLEKLTRRLVLLQESERKELARELHDRVGQYLTALNITLSIVSAQLPDDDSNRELRERLADSEVLIEATAAAVRSVVSGLRPPMLDDHGLIPALEWYAVNFSARTGLSVVVRGPEGEDAAATDVELALFRIAQEALNNVAKHARANEVDILVERSPFGYVMTIDDNGVGVDKAQGEWQAGLGIVTMRERAQAVDGDFELTALPRGGTRLIVRAPA